MGPSVTPPTNAVILSPFLLNTNNLFPVLYSEYGERLMSAQLEGKKNEDMEDIAIHEMNGLSHIYLGDIGNSDFNRDTFTIYR